ncbi:acyl dehydratase [Breoghania corrubedonensis]|uniref:Acyl dehydratase n=1 Tax=Breoghania corrubedonensis TaxID=665038 RepID=A0A2T5VDZ5_9HYPH|nr:MaoC family dehydratase [Breoghania corrubedonensis]PTW61980.1 acyl dehydratase [Breoghania corrubedonensis]
MDQRVDAHAYAQRIGEEVGVSGWITITQAMIDTFADLTFDHQFIHVDAERAATEGPFGGTIVHGFLTLSLLTRMAREAEPSIQGAGMLINYGFDKVRFLHVVPTGGRVRGRVELVSADERKSGEFTFCHRITVEIEGLDRPALVADWLTRLYVNG